MVARAASEWPAHGRRTVPWQQQQRGGSRADRTVREIEVRIPPRISTLEVGLPTATLTSLESALRAVVALDTAPGHSLRGLGGLLLRTESVASSKIERIAASSEDYARALHGSRANASAVAMVAATEAMDTLLQRIDRDGSVTAPALLEAHHRLMVDDPDERSYAGRTRDVQNWIGGSDHSPLGALYTPPPPDQVAGLVDDLVDFTQRRDLPTLAQAAIAHAQFESIHPFTDGNGRLGRALINAVLRARRTTTTVVVPLASALVARREQYFATLDAYRAGDLAPLLTEFARATDIAAAESRLTVDVLRGIPAAWADLVGTLRRGSAAAALLPHLVQRPVITAAEAVALLGTPPAGVYAAIERFREAGVLRPLTNRTRDQIWGAGMVLDELDDLDARIGAAARAG